MLYCYSFMMKFLKTAGIATLVFTLLLCISCSKKEVAPQRPETPRRVRGVVSISRTFNDLHKKHIEAATRLGVPAINDRKDAEQHTKDLVCIENSPYYQVDPLNYSVPYLVPKADALLQQIAINFNDSLNAKWLHPHQLIVTSVLRTKDDIKRLKKNNINATGNSAHLYGTTFDISWMRFKQIDKKGNYETLNTNDELLKNVLVEVLRDLQKQGKCYVKYEKNQACFHITVR